MALPDRLFYPLDKAAKKLKCDIDDILHHFYLRRVTLLLDVSINAEAILNEDAEDSEADPEYRSDTFGMGADNLDAVVSIVDEVPVYIKGKSEPLICQTWETFTYHDDFLVARIAPGDSLTPEGNIPESLLVKIEGLIRIHVTTREVEQLAKSPTQLDWFLSSINNSSTPVYFNYYPKSMTNIDDVYISHEDLNILKSGGLHKQFEYKQPHIIKTPAAKTLNAQNRFILSLLVLHYGEDIADRASQETDSKTGKIRLDLEKKGLPVPSKGTLGRWLDGIYTKDLKSK